MNKFKGDFVRSALLVRSARSLFFIIYTDKTKKRKSPLHFYKCLSGSPGKQNRDFGI
ncbi:MAG: hypothetical protein U7123_10960 [Potamolinea sp.]